MAGHVSPYARIPFFHERGPTLGLDKNLQVRTCGYPAKQPPLIKLLINIIGIQNAKLYCVGMIIKRSQKNSNYKL
jgi:hypothetical protein